MAPSSHPYEEPSITVILVLFGFILLLNVVHKALGSFLYCGLVGQVFVGVLFGTPGVKLLNSAVETTVSNLGYLGLILLIYQGGLSTSLSGLISSSALSLLVALTGILLPIALSFVLLPLGASPLQCFSAGASLSATSLGTTFATLSSSGLLTTHLGTVLTSAAMLDDVVGLIMLQVVAELSGGHGTASDYGKVVGRALGASVGLVVAVMTICRFALRPLYKPIRLWALSPKRGPWGRVVWEASYTSLAMHTALLVALTVAGSYAGTSVLLAAFIAGVMVRWWDDEVVWGDRGVPISITESGGSAPAASPETTITGLQVYDQYYGASAERILKPFFFASIGFSIPITRMFHASTVWKGFLYALLMSLGKLATGLWLVPSSLELTTRSRILLAVKRFGHQRQPTESAPGMGAAVTSNPNGSEVKPADTIASPQADGPFSCPSTGAHPVPPSALALDGLEPANPTANREELPKAPNPSPDEVEGSVLVLSTGPQRQTSPTMPSLPSPPPPALSPPSPSRPIGPPETRALRAYAPALVGLAMTARGEIGFLIASIAESRGVFGSSPPPTSNSPSGDDVGSSELYLVAVWAIVLCTIVGPVAVGGLVRRVKRLEMQEKNG